MRHAAISRIASLAFFLAALALCGCTRTVTVTVPPRVDLGAYSTIGVLEFAAQPKTVAGADATQKFLADISAAQPGLRLLELGSRETVLAGIGRSELDHRAIKAIGQKYGVQAVLSGAVELSEPRPDLAVAANLTSISAQSRIDGRLNAKLWEAASGATVWTNSSWGNWRVAGLTLGKNGGSAVVGQPQGQQDKMLNDLVSAVTGDFWPTLERRKVED